MKDVSRLSTSIALVLGIGFIGGIFTSQSLEWYETIKPEIAPPNWIFTSVWTILYILIGLVLFIAWKNRFWGDKKLLFLFFIQLALNFIWSPLFFVLRSPLLGFIDLIALDVAVFLTIVRFYSYSKVSSVLLLPYMCWISIATVLNYAVLA